jgi:hypothetical protein
VSTFEVMTADGLFILRDMTPQMFDAFARDAEDFGLESALQAWARIRDIDNTT